MLYSLNFIRLLRVVFSSQQRRRGIAEGVITTLSNRIKFRLHVVS